jgi:hypothetical protein
MISASAKSTCCFGGKFRDGVMFWSGGPSFFPLTFSKFDTFVRNACDAWDRKNRTASSQHSQIKIASNTHHYENINNNTKQMTLNTALSFSVFSFSLSSRSFATHGTEKTEPHHHNIKSQVTHTSTKILKTTSSR